MPLFPSGCIGIILLRRAFFTAIRAKDTAVAGLWPQQSAARRAAIELHSDIRRHRLGLLEAALGTSND
jgi:hypothetical protein